MLLFVLLFLFPSCFTGDVFEELNEDTSFLLSCPIKSKSDHDYLQHLISTGHRIDIFQEQLSEGIVVQLLADEESSEILRGRAGCYEEMTPASFKRLQNSKTAPKSEPEIGPEFHQDYRSYQNIVDQLTYYSRQHPKEVKLLKSIGKSHEGRDLMVIHLTSSSNSIASKPLVWIMAGQHAREWIAPAAAMYLIELLLKNQDILDNFEFAIMPLVNPDGYEYSRTKNRMWRKNRRGVNGVDLNRNWDHRWCEIGCSKNPRMESYCGTEPASEPEIRAIQSYILTLLTRFIGFDVHSFGQWILRNYGWTATPGPHEPILYEISKKMSKNMFDLNGVYYKHSLSFDLYPASGSAEDWMYVKAGILGFVLELRDEGKFGFSLPKSQIKPTGEELYIGIVTAITGLKTYKH